MTQPYKSCPNCETPAYVEAAQCSRCGHQFLTSAPTPGMPPASSFGPSGPSPFSPAPPYMPPGMYAPQYSITPQEINSKRMIAGILGILLGGFGIHKFLLGKTQAGVIMLLVSVLSCGLAAPIMHVIGIVEGIMYLTKSDAEFYHTYLVGDKEWF